jgi:hypothetical protein
MPLCLIPLGVRCSGAKEGIVSVVTAGGRVPTSGPTRHRYLRKALGRAVVAGGLTTFAGTCARACGERSFDRLVSTEVDALLAGSRTDQALVATEEMVDKLPPPMQRYLHYTGVIGTPIARTVRVAQSGRMRISPGLPWLPLRAKEYYSVYPPGFVWDGALQVGRVPVARARDMYIDGKGGLLVKVASAFTAVDCGGDEVDQASLMRYLSEMVWFPPAFLLGNVSFETVDEGAARVTLADHGRTVTGILSVDPAGRLTNFIAQRHCMVAGRLELRTWSTPVHEYGVKGGLRLPVRGRGVWHLEDGDFEYFDVWLDDLSYDDMPRNGLGRG